MTALRIIATVAGFLLLPALTSAQTVTGKVIDASGAPVRGAFVQLLRAGGPQVAAVLSNADGSFAIRTQTGRFALRVDLIGHHTAQVDAFDLGPSESRAFTVRLDASAIKLQALSVTGSRRCRIGSAEANATSAVWKEAVRALEVSRWVESGGAGVFRSRVYKKFLDGNLRPIDRPEMRFITTPGTRAFAALPPDTLSRFGFIRDVQDSVMLYGPDAEVLLSDVFLNDHCFWLERDPAQPGLIGLGFEPVPDRRVPEIRGVLWLDEQTAALRFIDYRYVNMRYYEDRNFAGGRTEFEHLPTGAWIIRKWYIRAPVLGRNARGNVQVTRALETGGEVLDVVAPNAKATTLVPRFDVAGFVYDSVRAAPLAHAQVYLAGTGFAARADEHGAFVITDVPQGDYFITFAHPRMDSLPEYPTPVPLHVDSVAEPVQLAVASALTFTENWCTPEERLRVRELTFDTTTSNRGLLFGRVRTAEGPLEGAVVSVSWKRLLFPTANIMDAINKPASIEIDTDHAGRFSLCGLPINHPFTIAVRYGKQRMIDPDLRLGYDALLYRDYLFRRAP